MATIAKELKSWFDVGHARKADRTLKQQLKGLEELQAGIAGKTVLDIGCAEGLISMQLVDRGAASAHGIDMRPDFIEDAMRLRGDRPCTFETANANDWEPPQRYDVVIMLALLHKLKNPTEACLRYAAAARETVVLRLPPKEAPFIIDERSGGKPFDIAKAMHKAGFVLGTHGRIGPHQEWMGYYSRVA